MKPKFYPVTKIFYFSSTGNSLMASRKIAEYLGNTQIFNIPKCINTEIDFSANRIIVVFPVYMWGLPNIIFRFFEKIQLSEKTQLIAVATNAGLAGDPFKQAKKILIKNNQKLNYGFLIWMPENFTPRYPVSPLWLQKLSLRLSDRKINRICKIIQNNKSSGTYEKSHFGINWFLTYMHNYMINMIWGSKPLLAKDYFWTTEKCNGCGICTKSAQLKILILKMVNQYGEIIVNSALAVFSGAQKKPFNS